MTQRRTLSFVPLLPVIIIFAAAWFATKGRPTAQTYRGKTAMEWEHELEQWQAIDYEYYYRHQTRWSAWKAIFGFQVPARDLVDERLVAAIHEPDFEAIPVLTELLGAREASVRCIAAYGLSRLGKSASSAIPALTVALKDSDTDVRFHAESALERIDPDRRSKASSLDP